MDTDPQKLRLTRILLACGAVAYLGWWLFIHLSLPQAFNPFFGRALVVACFLGVLGLSFLSKSVAQRFGIWFAGCCWLLTGHYFYLFEHNQPDLNWVIGSFITVIAVCAILQTARALLLYALFVTCLVIALLLRQESAAYAVFLPGMLTILVFANLGLRGRLKVVAQLEATNQKLLAAEQARALYDSTRDALKMRDEFISIASHELKTPLTTLRLRTDLGKRSLAQGKTEIFERDWILRFLQQTDSQTSQLIKLVDDMLDLARLGTGRLSLALEPLDLSEVARDTATAMADLLTLANCQLTLQLTPGVRVVADRARMRQLISGLLNNVIKYGAGKPATLALQAVGAEAVLSVKDGGIGIAKENQARIFEKFERAVSPRNFSGLGLGLYICREITVAHQGRIDVESELGQGSVFRVRLPLAPRA